MQLLLADTSSINNFFQLISVLFIFIIVLAVTYATTRWIARYQQGITKNSNIKVIETSKVAQNKYIQIIQIGSKYYAIAVCKDQMTLLAQLEEEQIQVFHTEMKSGTEESFKDLFENIKKRIQKK